MDTTETKPTNTHKTYIWDIPIRLFHWGLVAAIATSWASVKLDYMDIHVISGATVMGLMIFRLLWGIWGSSSAQFHRFVPSPKKLFDYLSHKTVSNTHQGHSPLGALSVIALLGIISLQFISGLFMDDDLFVTGPLAHLVSSDGIETANWAHVLLSDILLILIGLHIAAILFYWLIKKDNLVGPMLHGFRKTSTHQHPITIKHPLLAIVTIAIAASATYYVFKIL